MYEATIIIDGLTMPESPRWHDGRLWFSDLYSNRVLSAREDGGDVRVEAEVDGPPCGLGWLPDGRLLIIEQAHHHLLRQDHGGALAVHADLSEHSKSRPNDMAVMADGTVYLGCWGFDVIKPDPVDTAPLLRVTPGGEVSIVGEPMHFPNGCMVVDEKRLLVAESFGNRISEFDVQRDGSLTDRRDWATFGPLPTAVDLNERYRQVVVAADGITQVDADSGIWVADFTQRHANRVLPGGEITETVSTGDHNCYSVALGGDDGQTLFLCATKADEDEMAPELRANNPQGTIQSYRVGVPLASAT